MNFYAVTHTASSIRKMLFVCVCVCVCIRVGGYTTFVLMHAAYVISRVRTDFFFAGEGVGRPLNHYKEGGIS